MIFWCSSKITMANMSVLNKIYFVMTSQLTSSTTPTWKWTRATGASWRLVPIMRTMLRYCPHNLLSHTGTSYSKNTHIKILITPNPCMCMFSRVIHQLLWWTGWACVHSPCLDSHQSSPGQCGKGERRHPRQTLKGLLFLLQVTAAESSWLAWRGDWERVGATKSHSLHLITRENINDTSVIYIICK